jgi:hypothetical protein
VERIVSYVADKIDRAANGVAIFACWAAQEFFEAIDGVGKLAIGLLRKKHVQDH